MPVSEERKAKMREYYQQHKAEFAERTKKWAAMHPDKIREKNHEQYLKRKAQKEAESHGEHNPD